MRNCCARILPSRSTLVRGLHALEKQLHSLSPLGVLNRGYALVYDDSGALVRDAAALRPKQKLITRVAKGSIESSVINTNDRTVKI